MTVELGPIYKLTPPEFVIPSIENQELSKSDKEFWSNNSPDEIVLASGSVRKAVMLLYQLYEMKYQLITFDSETGDRKVTNQNPTPDEFYDHLCAHTTNGNGELKVKTLIGFFHGVPVYVDPQDGETKDNHPGKQATNKVLSMTKLSKYQGKDIIFIATDTVDGPAKHELRYYHLASQHPLFPRNEEAIKQVPRLAQENWPDGAKDELQANRLIFMQVYHSLRTAMVGNERTNDGIGSAVNAHEGGLLLGKPSSLEYFPKDPEQQKVFLYWYKELLLTPVEQDDKLRQLIIVDDQMLMVHTNGIAIVRKSKNEDSVGIDQVKVTTTDIVARVADRSKVIARSNSGGGGMIQQAGINFEIPSELVNVFPQGDIALEVIEKLTDDELKALGHIVFNQITGMPGWIITHLLS